MIRKHSTDITHGGYFRFGSIRIQCMFWEDNSNSLGWMKGRWLGDQVGATNIVQVGEDEVLDHSSEDAGGGWI